MNERIQRMINDLNEKVGVQWTNEDKKKFGKLIAQKCAIVAYRADHYHGDAIIDHFKLPYIGADILDRNDLDENQEQDNAEYIRRYFGDK